MIFFDSAKTLYFSFQTATSTFQTAIFVGSTLSMTMVLVAANMHVRAKLCCVLVVTI
jgi:hypothetical protein